MRRYELTSEQWQGLESLLPLQNTGKKGRPPKDNRLMLNGMVWISRTGAQWRELPACYGPWQSVYARFRKWQTEGILEQVFKALSSDYDPENLSILIYNIRPCYSPYFRCVRPDPADAPGAIPVNWTHGDHDMGVGVQVASVVNTDISAHAMRYKVLLCIRMDKAFVL